MKKIVLIAEMEAPDDWDIGQEPELIRRAESALGADAPGSVAGVSLIALMTRVDTAAVLDPYVRKLRREYPRAEPATYTGAIAVNVLPRGHWFAVSNTVELRAMGDQNNPVIEVRRRAPESAALLLAESTGERQDG